MFDVVAWVRCVSGSKDIPSDIRFRVMTTDGRTVTLKDRQGNMQHIINTTCPIVQHRTCYILYEGTTEYRVLICEECTRNLQK